MEKNNVVTKRDIIMPIIAIIAFLILLGGASYAYFSQYLGTTTAAANIANGNVALPKACVFAANTENCGISADNTMSIDFTDNTVSRGEMGYEYRNNVIATTSCNVSAEVSGKNNCVCTYEIRWVLDYNYSLPNPGYENSMTIKLDSSNTSKSIPEQNLSSFTLATSSLQVGVEANVSYTITLNVYNRDYDQMWLSNRHYDFPFRVIASSCRIWS